MSSESSEDFFNTFGSSPKKTAAQLNLKSSRLPPPPPGATKAATASTSSSSYYTTPSASRAPPPPPVGQTPATTASNPSTTRRPPQNHNLSRAPRPNPASTSAASASGGYYGTSSFQAPSSTPSYYDSTTASTSVTASTTTSSSNASISYSYGAAPAASSYPYSSASATASSTPVPHTQPSQPHIMNPYNFNFQQTSTEMSGGMDTGASQLSGNMDTGATLMSGPMDGGQAQPHTFVPRAPAPSSGTFGPYDPTEFEDEPPLLEELGINVEHIVGKMRSVILPIQRFGGNMDATVIQDADLAGPVALALLLGGELMLGGKLQFGYIYGFGLFGCVAMTLVLNFMSPKEAISFWTVTSILGYSLLPVNLLALVKLVVVNLGNLQAVGRILAMLTVLWCTISSTRLMEQGCDMRDQRYLIAYPIALLYTAFVMITIF